MSASAERVSPVTEDYVQAIFRLETRREPVVGARLAEQLRVAPASVAEGLSRLRRDGLVSLDRPVRLTAAGREMASTLVARHRLIERFLVDTLGFGWEEVHEEAHRLEHALSPVVTERLRAFLGNPTTCPHGHPIADLGTKDLTDGLRRLSDVAPGLGGRVNLILEEDPELLGLLSSLGIGLGTSILVVRVDPFGGPLHLRVDGRDQVIGSAAARMVLVSDEDAS